MKNLRQILTFFLALLLSVSMLSETVLAAGFTQIACEDNTGKVKNGANGLFDPNIVFDKTGVPSCEETNITTIFSGIACNYINILNDVFSQFYCSLQFGMLGILTAVITLYVTLFGLRVLVGMQEVTRGAVIIAAIKIGAVVLIATNAALGVGVIHHFFMTFITQTIEWIISGINLVLSDFNPLTSKADPTSSIFRGIDVRMDSMIQGADDGTGKLENGLFSDNAKLIVLFLGLMTICQPLFQMALTLIFTTFKILVSALVSFLMSITAVSFLISLSPIFLAFMLFNSTFNLFDSWIRFLVSYSLQPMLVFSVFSLWVFMIGDFTGFIKQISDVTRTAKFAHDTTANAKLYEAVAFCQLRYKTTPKSFVNLTINPDPALVDVGGPKIGCCTLINNPDPTKTARICDNTENIRTLGDPNIPGAVADTHYIEDKDLILPAMLIREEEFIYFLAYNFISLLIISYAFMNMMNVAPEIAKELAAASFPIPLGTGLKGRNGGGGLNSIVNKLSVIKDARAKNNAGKADTAPVGKAEAGAKTPVTEPKQFTQMAVLTPQKP